MPKSKVRIGVTELEGPVAALAPPRVYKKLFDLDDKQKAEIEDAYEKLSPEVWLRVISTTLLFVGRAQRHGPTHKSFVAKVARFKSAAEELWTDMHEQPLARCATLEEVAKRYFSNDRLGADIYFTYFLTHCAAASVEVCHFALERMRDTPGAGKNWFALLSPDTEWAYWIHRITQIMKVAKLPTRVRKDFGKRKTDEPSPFVRLVYELQKHVPEKVRRHMPASRNTTDQAIYLDALSQAISRARRASAEFPHMSSKSFRPRDAAPRANRRVTNPD